MTDPNDPARWSEGDPSPLGELFAAARRDGATTEELGKLAQRLEPTFGASLSTGRIALFKLVSGAAIAALGLAGGWYLLDRSTEASAPKTRQASPSVQQAGPSSPLPSAAPSESTAPTPVPAPAVASSSRTSSTESESSLLERARRELSASPARALSLANEHARRFPRGMLSQEREVIAIAALRRLGRSAEADHRAARFDRSYPNSAHQRTVDDDTR